MARILDGKWVRDQILKDCVSRIERLSAAGRPPGLAVVLVGNDAASEIYVRNKVKTSGDLGIYSEKLTPSASVTTEELLEIVEGLNARADIDGILVQMPLPAQVDSARVLLAVDPEKDVDGFHPLNVGNLVTNRPGPRGPGPRPFSSVFSVTRMFVRSRLFDRFASARALVGLVVLLSALPALAEDGAVRLSTFDNVALADGRKTVTVTAVVTDHAGRYVPDGTIIRFETDLGQFKNPTVATINGLARAFLTAPTFAGTAHVKASAFPTLNASAELSIEFVSNRSLLESAKDYIEIVAPKYLMYSTELRTVEAAGEGREVEVRYRDIEIEAAHVQVNIPMYEVRARKAILRIGKLEREFDQLYLRLNIRQGLGTTVYEDDTPRVYQQPPFVWVDQEKRLRMGTMEISGGEFLPYTSTVPPSQFVFANLSNSVTLISAKKAVAYPSREIQFHRADLMVGGAKVMKVPLFQISAVTNSPIVTDQFLNVTSNQVAIDYPHYLSLKPGETSLLRFRTGTRYGSGVGATRGTSLDYELHWNRGSDSEGGLVVSGLLRKDWGVGLRHGLKLDDRTSASAQVDFPAHTSMFGTAQISRQFDGFNASATASMGKTLSGTPYQNQQYFLSLDKDP
ncbi:MAG: bifunctional 5,10-methylenetetrahydrofolate dehydrogenase/5,10-methenyltetrahydrofolate cyclohydrolase, partial [Bryobacteraceae bacterium]|nr:bifunctional 5,10-methylenetetrahydrofolate dehydrogenase/5,10-methenyltetrahydrofolate cyclohydrolase [Bryobacteraceae bacterium]